MAWTCTLVSLIGATSECLISSNDGADPASLEMIRGKTEAS